MMKKCYWPVGWVTVGYAIGLWVMDWSMAHSATGNIPDPIIFGGICAMLAMIGVMVISYAWTEPSNQTAARQRR